MAVPVVLSVEVVQDFDFRIGVDVGGEFWGEDFGKDSVDFFSEWSSAHVLEQHFLFAGSSFAVGHGYFVDGLCDYE